MIAGELCPSCGEFVDELVSTTGWCGSCTSRNNWQRREQRQPVVPVWKNCKYCGIRFPFETTSATFKKWGTCTKCLSIVRSRSRNGLPPLQPSGRCEHCHREFDFAVAGGPRMYCPACQPWFRRQRAIKAGRVGKVLKGEGHAYNGGARDNGRFTRKGVV